MVLGISLRRRKQKDVPVIRPSPSLPNIAATGLSPADWPEELVDITSIKKEVVATSNHDQAREGSVRKSTVVSPSRTVPFFHRPFRPADHGGKASPDPTQGRKSIASMFSANPPPSAFGNHSTLQKVPSVRRLVRVPPKFNVMVVGGHGTGKTSFVKLLLNTCDISPTADESDVTAVKAFCEGTTRRTKAIKTLSLEVCEERHERIHLTVTDTIGFDFEPGHELDLDRGVSNLVKYLDAQFSETMGEESKVVRQSKGDKHVHLCIYLVNPDTIMSPAARRAKRALSFPAKTATTLHHRTSLSSITSAETSDSSSEEEPGEDLPNGDGAASPKHGKKRSASDETMAPAELQVIKRLAVRCNVLPVVAHADTLSDERLALVRRVVRRDLMEAGLGFGVFEPSPTDDAKATPKSPATPVRQVKINSPQTPSMPSPSSDAQDEDSEEERASRPVIKLKSRGPFTRDRSRSRRRQLGLEDDDGFLIPQSPTGQAPPVPPTDLTSWPKQTKSEVADMLPFSIICPEEPAKPKPSGRRRTKSDAAKVTDIASIRAGHAEDAEASKTDMRRRGSVKDLKSCLRGPADMQGQFVRHYRWGTIDVLNPVHCDFVAMRTAILGTHLRILKNNTKEVLYEEFRTEKLLARRATRHITDTERKKLLHELGV